jgi:hypothetical protein
MKEIMREPDIRTNWENEEIEIKIMQLLAKSQ